jgi:hypothetical protein
LKPVITPLTYNLRERRARGNKGGMYKMNETISKRGQPGESRICIRETSGEAVRMNDDMKEKAVGECRQRGRVKRKRR